MKKLEDIVDFDSIEKEVDRIMNDAVAREEFENALAQHCYDALPENRKKIYDEATTVFSTREELVGEVLSALTMGYPDYGLDTIEKMSKEHSKLYTPYVLTPALEWTFTKMSEESSLKAPKNTKYC